MNISREDLERGVTCGNCGQWCKVYRRRLHHGTAVALIHLYRDGGFVHWNSIQKMAKVSSAGVQMGLLRWWGLAESDKKGNWNLTEKGRAFVRGELRVRKYVYTYAGKVIEPPEGDDETVDIHDVINHSFDYAEMMGWT